MQKKGGIIAINHFAIFIVQNAFAVLLIAYEFQFTDHFCSGFFLCCLRFDMRIALRKKKKEKT
jgi:hypothetical protein